MNCIATLHVSKHPRVIFTTSLTKNLTMLLRLSYVSAVNIKQQVKQASKNDDTQTVKMQTALALHCLQVKRMCRLVC